jgi:hypothetical protein
MLPTIAVTPSRTQARKQLRVSLYAAAVAFLAYTSVYAYRKPFTVATFEGIEFWHIPYQTLLIISQGIGYMASKFYGIKFISELKRLGRWKTMAILLAISWMALLGFALVPPPYGIFFLFINGVPLGFFWGIIFSYVEGRRATDMIGSAMAVSFIFAGGFTRSVAKWLLIEGGIAENRMPFVTGLLFAAPMALLIFLLEKVPPPDAEDIVERTERLPMTRPQRIKFLGQFSVGIFCTTLVYLFLTLLRDIRDNFMGNIWTDLGHGSDYGVFTTTETNTSVAVLLIMSFLVLVKNNIKAFRLVHFIIFAGLIIAGGSSALFVMGKLSGEWWMQLVSLGLYMSYIPFNCIFFERLIAVFKIKGNVGFLMYFADAFGYLGSTVVMCSKALFRTDWNWSRLYSQGAVIASAIGLVAIVFSFIYFNRKYRLRLKV